MSPFDEMMLSAMRGMTTNAAEPEPQEAVTSDSIMASMREAMASLGPPQRQIIQSIYLTDRIEDWSRVRSPSRAERRRKRGFHQNIIVTDVPKPDAYRIDGKIFVHPVTWQRAKSKMGWG